MPSRRCLKPQHGKPLGRFELEGAFVTVAGKRYTAPRVVYQTCQLVDKINDVKHKDDKLENIKKLKEVIPFASLQNDASLAEIDIVVANKFVLDIVDEQDFTMSPVFVEHDDKGTVEILPRNHQKEYSKKFLQYNEAKDTHTGSTQ